MAGELFGDMVQETRTDFDANKSRNLPYGSHGNTTILTAICIVLAQQNIILRGSRFCFLRSIEISPQDAVTERHRVSSRSICSLENCQIIWILLIRENSNKKNATIVLAIDGNNWNWTKVLLCVTRTFRTIGELLSYCIHVRGRMIVLFISWTKLLVKHSMM